MEMRSIEDKGCLSYGQVDEISSMAAINHEFHRGKETNNNTCSHHRTGLGKPTPSKWDDAQKWLVNLSRGVEKTQSKTKPRNSNADDRRLIAPVPKKEDYSSGSGDEEGNGRLGSASVIHYGMETKKVDCEESIWRVDKPSEKSSSSSSAVRSICVRDMGTEMTPIASQEPSRTTTPIRVMSPMAATSPASSGSSSPVKCQHGSAQTVMPPVNNGGRGRGVGIGTTAGQISRDGEESNAHRVADNKDSQQPRKVNPLETRAVAWDEAERAKYMARFKQEEVKIQAWENHEKRKAEMEMRRMEVKAERLKSRAQEKLANKLAATRRIAEEKRANAEAKLNEKAVKTSERADYIRRTGHLPSSFSFSFKCPSFCW